MRKIKYLLFVLLLLGMNRVQAITISPECPSKVKNGDTITVPVYVNKGSNEEAVYAIEGTFSYQSSQLQLISYNLLLSNWNILSQSNTFSFGDFSYNYPINGNTKVFNVIFKVLNTTTSNIGLAITGANATNDDGDNISNVSGLGCEMAMASDVNTLSSITLSSGTLSSSFSSNILNYNVTVNADTITVNYTKTDNKSSVSCNCNNVKLKYGNNIIKIVVTSEAGNSRTYTLTVNRPDNRDTNNNLSSLSLSKGKIDFKPDTTSYNVNVDSDIDSIKITSSLASNKASYVDWSKEKTVSLKPGVNVFNIVVRAENGSTKTYKLSITRKDNRDTNNDLSDITLSSGTLNFDTKILEYVVHVTSDVETITIEPKLSSSKAKYDIKGPDKLELGDNNYEIIVTAENGSVKTYKINIIKNELMGDEELSDVALLESLSIVGYDINFDSNTFLYSIVSDDTQFKIIAVAKEKGAYYVLNDGKIDSNGKLIVRVTAENGDTKDYVINVKKATVKNGIDKQKLFFIIFIVETVVIVIAIILIIYLLINRKKENKQKEIENVDIDPSINSDIV